MRMPMLLDGHTLNQKARFHPEAMQVTLKTDPFSTAVMTLPPTDPSVVVSDWVEVFAPNGEICIMRVTSVNMNYVTNTRTVNMEHVLAVLQDDIIIGKKTYSVNQTIRSVIEDLLGGQSTTVWTVGMVDDFGNAQAWEFNNSGVYDALDEITDSCQDCVWTFDMSTLPFRLNLKKFAKDDPADCEMRMNRNIVGMQVNVDRSGMYTRVYPVGKSNLMIKRTVSGQEVNYIEKNVDKYGVIAKVLTDQSYNNAAALEAFGRAQLERNCTPMVTITITGLQLAELTGEPIDRLRINTVCNVPLPDYGETFKERITQLTWQDCIKDEYSVQVTMANERQTMTHIIKKQSAGSRRAVRNTGCHLQENEQHVDDITEGEYQATKYLATQVACEKLNVGEIIQVTEGENGALYWKGHKIGVYTKSSIDGGNVGVLGYVL